MTDAFESSVFPAPPQKRNGFVALSRENSSSSTVSNKNSDCVDSSLRRSSRSSGINELASQSDVRFLCEYVTRLRKDLLAEQKRRSKEIGALKKQLQKVCNNCNSLTGCENGKTSDVQDMLEKLKDCPQVMVSMQLQMDRMDRSMVDFRSSMSCKTGDLRDDRIRRWGDASHTQGRGEDAWSAQCIFVVDSTNPNVYEVEGIAYLKLQHGRPVQNVLFSGDSSLSFVLGIQAAFSGLLKSRAWMPLASQRSSDEAQSSITLDSLKPKDRNTDCWSRNFLDEFCTTYDMHGRSHIYIALQHEVLSLTEIQSLTVAWDYPRRSSSAGAKSALSYPSGPRCSQHRDQHDSSSPALESPPLESSALESPALDSSFSDASTKHDSANAGGFVIPRKARPNLSIDSAATAPPEPAAQLLTMSTIRPSTSVPNLLQSLLPSPTFAISYSRPLNLHTQNNSDDRLVKTLPAYPPSMYNPSRHAPKTPSKLSAFKPWSKSGRRKNAEVVQNVSDKDRGRTGVHARTSRLTDMSGTDTKPMSHAEEAQMEKTGFWKRNIRSQWRDAAGEAIS